MFYNFIIILAFLLDILIFSFFPSTIVQASRFIFYYLLILGCSSYRLIIALFFLLLQSFLVYDKFGIDFLILVPIVFLINYFRESFNINIFIAFILAIIAFIIHFFIIDFFIFKVSFYKIFKDLICVASFLNLQFMLKYILGGRGSRFKNF